MTRKLAGLIKLSKNGVETYGDELIIAGANTLLVERVGHIELTSDSRGWIVVFYRDEFPNMKNLYGDYVTDLTEYGPVKLDMQDVRVVVIAPPCVTTRKQAVEFEQRVLRHLMNPSTEIKRE